MGNEVIVLNLIMRSLELICHMISLSMLSLENSAKYSRYIRFDLYEYLQNTQTQYLKRLGLHQTRTDPDQDLSSL